MAGGLEREPVDVVRFADEQALEAPLGSGGSVGRSARAGRRLSGRSRRAASPHSGKFRTATALLSGVAVGAIVVAIILLAQGRASNGAAGGPWSQWSPPDTGAQGATEIAQHLAPLYRISSTAQLAIVTVVRMANSSAAAATQQTGQSSGSGLQVAVQPNSASSQVSLLGGTTVAYNLCGIGSTNCAIGVGTPSTNRLLLLRREALELALYTFKYLSNVDNVVAILPPGHTEQASALTPRPPKAGVKTPAKPINIAVLFLRDELKPFLQQPVSATLPEEFPPSVAQVSAAPESGLVAQITSRGLFSERIVQAQDGSNLLMLNPLPPQ